MDEELVTLEGTVLETLYGAQFRVKLEDERLIVAFLSNALRQVRTRVVKGDRVLVDTLPGIENGKITKRL
ncbi:translation initiation factor IF-1 [Streptomyces sp. NPDC058672]|uniref:translation initiation factor IF-1 n=1 Tax=unclassified Streptomyces TaxID=2593676 RepID=UPI00364AF653